ncbi:hypothetical protein JCM33374_g5195 [Metschnikowia sp. JCM 33374]|nr:hypothetical protein JCM33374_g5195 [Metschnikowia sp. JCM 33374]
MAHTPGDSGPYKRQRTFVQDDVDSLRATSNQPIFQRSPVPLIPELTVSHPTTLPYGVIPSNSVQSPSYPFLPYLYNAHPDIPSKVEENSMPLTDQISNKAVRLPSISNIVDLPPFYSVKYPSNVSHVGSFHGEAVPIQRSVTCSHDSVMGQTIVDPYPMYHHHHSVGKVPEIPSASVNQFISPANPRVLSSNIKTEVPSQTSSNLPTLPHSRMQKVQLKEIIEQNHQENDTKLVPKETYQATSTVPKPVTQLKPMSNAEISFTKYLPKFSDISATTVSSLLAQVLHECHHHVSNEDFFNLLYNEEVQCIGSKSADSFFKLDNSESSKPKYHALELCLLILETFKDPASLAARFKDKSLRKLSFTSIKFHEILREFLALKIILSVVEPAKDASDYHPNISRISVYKVYYILCQRLIQSYPAFLSSTGQSIILGQSQLGKITKAAYPDLRSKRLGRRGHSRSHYIDVNWNESIVCRYFFHA